MDILTVYSLLTPSEKKLLHMAFDDGSYELVRMGPDILDGEHKIFISVNHIDNPEFLALETKNHWTIGRIVT